MISNSTLQDLVKEQGLLKKIIRQKEDEISRAPEGSVLVRRYKESVQFFFRNSPSDHNGTYIPASERKRAVALVQKRYNRRLLSAAKRQKKAIDAFLKVFDPNALEKVFEKEGPLRRQFLIPAELPDAEYIAAWESYEYEPKAFREDGPVHYTQKHERVRSKSEVLIANALYQAKIPYRYECPLRLGDHVIHPDFTILRMRDRKEVYWEHLGLIDDAEYRNHVLRRIREYEKNGIFPGTRLILTTETFRAPFHLGIAESMIGEYLC